LTVAKKVGVEALLAHTGAGHPPKLTPEQMVMIPEFLWHGAEAYGFRGDVWTCPRIAQVIRWEFGVSYHKDHISRLMKELGWTPQIPITRAIQRDEEAIERWRVEVWPELRRKAVRERRTLVFIDESGFYLLPGKVKTYGPKGIGALYVRRKPRIRLEAQMHGGGHERGFRSGTLATHQIVGMGECFRLAKEEMVEENIRVGALRDRLLNGLQDMEEVFVNGDLEQRVAHNLNISFAYVEGESMIMAIKDLAVSSGSACTSASLEPSYVLRALGRNDELAHSSIRFSIGRFTTQEEIDYAINLLKAKVGKLRELSPLWDMFKDGIDLSTVQWAAH